MLRGGAEARERGTEGGQLAKQLAQLARRRQVPTIVRAAIRARAVVVIVAAVRRLAEAETAPVFGPDGIGVGHPVLVAYRVTRVGVVGNARHVIGIRVLAVAAVWSPIYARKLLQGYCPAVLLGVIHVKYHPHRGFARHGPVGWLHNAVVGAQNVANGNGRGRSARHIAGILAQGLQGGALAVAYQLRLGYGRQRGGAHHGQLQHAHAVAAGGGGVAVGKDVYAHAVLPWQVKALLVVLAAGTHRVGKEEVVRAVRRNAQGGGAAAAAVLPAQGQHGGHGRIVGKEQLHLGAVLSAHNLHARRHAPLHRGKGAAVHQDVAFGFARAGVCIARNGLRHIKGRVHREVQGNHAVALPGGNGADKRNGVFRGVQVQLFLYVGGAEVEAVAGVGLSLAHGVVNGFKALQYG